MSYSLPQSIACLKSEQSEPEMSQLLHPYQLVAEARIQVREMSSWVGGGAVNPAEAKATAL